MTWPCFLIEEHEHYVDALVIHGGAFAEDDSPLHRTVYKRFHNTAWDDRPSVEDVDWPEVCPVEGCDHRLDREADRNVFSFMGSCTYRNTATGEVKTHHYEFGPGAMFDATDWSPWRASQTPDGKVWGVVLPPGGQVDIWIIDHQASSGGYWTRTGEPPNLTVSPSIKTPNYHGFLQGGVLTDDVEGKVFS